MTTPFPLARRISAADVARREGLHLRRRGAKEWACCPLHGEKTASLCFYEDGRWYCFGCHRHGDAVDLYAALQQVLFDGIVDILCLFRAEMADRAVDQLQSCLNGALTDLLDLLGGHLAVTVQVAGHNGGQGFARTGGADHGTGTHRVLSGGQVAGQTKFCNVCCGCAGNNAGYVALGFINSDSQTVSDDLYADTILQKLIDTENRNNAYLRNISSNTSVVAAIMLIQAIFVVLFVLGIIR